MTTPEITTIAEESLPAVAPSPEVAKAVAETIKAARRRPATFDDLMNKKRRELDVVITTQDEDGYDVELVLRYRALGARAFDELIAKCPPNSKQKLDGLIYNPDTFGPALVSAVCVSPMLTVEQAQTLMESQDWSAGEAGTLSGEAMRLCQVGAGVPFTAAG